MKEQKSSIATVKCFKKKMLKMSFIMEMEKYCCEMLGIVACASICLAEHWGKFSLPSC